MYIISLSYVLKERGDIYFSACQRPLDTGLDAVKEPFPRKPIGSLQLSKGQAGSQQVAQFISAIKS